MNDIIFGGSIGGCKVFDIKCVCENGFFFDNFVCCFEKNCDEVGKEVVVKYVV